MEKTESLIAVCSGNHSAIQENIEFLTAGFRDKATGITCRKVQGIPSLAVAEGTYRVIGTNDCRFDCLSVYVRDVSHFP